MTDPIYTDQYCGELFRRAVAQQDQQAWEVVQQRFGEMVLGWLRRHPNREAACRLASETHYIAQAFARFRQTAVHQQVEFRALADILQYLCASLNGVILDALRASSRPGDGALPKPGDSGEPVSSSYTGSGEVWEILRRMLPTMWEQRLAYLLFH